MITPPNRSDSSCPCPDHWKMFCEEDH